nr:hypothetical protein [Streptomyces sp. S10(2018)]
MSAGTYGVKRVWQGEHLNLSQQDVCGRSGVGVAEHRRMTEITGRPPGHAHPHR